MLQPADVAESSILCGRYYPRTSDVRSAVQGCSCVCSFGVQNRQLFVVLKGRAIASLGASVSPVLYSLPFTSGLCSLYCPSDVACGCCLCLCPVRGAALSLGSIQLFPTCGLSLHISFILVSSIAHKYFQPFSFVFNTADAGQLTLCISINWWCIC